MLEKVAVAESYMVPREKASIENGYLTALVAVAEDVSYMTEEGEHGLHNLDHTLSKRYLHEKGLGRASAKVDQNANADDGEEGYGHMAD